MHPAHGGNIQAVAAEFGLSPKEILDFSANLNPAAPTIPDELWLEWKDSIHSYPTPSPEAVEAKLSSIYPVSSEHIITTNGALDAIAQSLALFEGRRILIPAPSFSEYPHLSERAGLKVQTLPVPIEEWHELPTLLEKVLQPGDVVLFANPNNPTGDWIGTDQLESLIARHEKVQWIIDEAYADFIPDNQSGLLSKITDLPQLILVRSLTKFWSVPGLRIGFLATGNTKILNQIRSQRNTWSMPALNFPWSEAFLNMETYRKITVRLASVSKYRNDLAAQLETISGLKPRLTESPFFLLETDTDSNRLWKKLARQGLLTRTTNNWPGLSGDRHLRISPRCSADNRRLINALTS